MSVIGALASVVMGGKYVHEETGSVAVPVSELSDV
jgi:hypothetical protein